MFNIEYLGIRDRAAPFVRLVNGFLIRESGAVTVDFTVASAAIVGIGLAVISVVSGGVEDLARDTSAAMTADDIVFRSANFGQSRADVIAGMTWASYNNGNHARNHFNNIVANRTDAQLRNGHRNWVNAANDPDHENHAIAADRATVFRMALDERGLEPHEGY